MTILLLAKTRVLKLSNYHTLDYHLNKWSVFLPIHKLHTVAAVKFRNDPDIFCGDWKICIITGLFGVQTQYCQESRLSILITQYIVWGGLGSIYSYVTAAVTRRVIASFSLWVCIENKKNIPIACMRIYVCLRVVKKSKKKKS